MKRFTVMLPEDIINQIKRANYSPGKKRLIIETVMRELFYNLERSNYPKTIEISMNIRQYQFDDK